MIAAVYGLQVQLLYICWHGIELTYLIGTHIYHQSGVHVSRLDGGIHHIVSRL